MSVFNPFNETEHPNTGFFDKGVMFVLLMFTLACSIIIPFYTIAWFKDKKTKNIDRIKVIVTIILLSMIKPLYYHIQLKELTDTESLLFTLFLTPIMFYFIYKYIILVKRSFTWAMIVFMKRINKKDGD